MSAKKNTQGMTDSTLPPLKIGSRVRCTDDGILGKITWANGVSVKIQWDDGEMVTWRRDELTGKPLVLLAADDEPGNEQPEPEIEQVTAEASAVTAVIEPVEGPAQVAEITAEQANVTQPLATDSAPVVPAEQRTAVPLHEGTAQAAEPTADATTALSSDTPAAAALAKPKRARQVKEPTEPKVKKPSALNAAARVLAEAGQDMTCKELIDVMAARGYWTSPGGQTPDATLCSAILRELKVKGEQSRFVKAAPGRFALRTTA